MTKCIVIANTAVARGKSITEDEFVKAQVRMDQPVVMFLNGNEEERSFNIEAVSIDELWKMYEMKVFYTSDLPEMEYEWHHGAVFVGKKPSKRKRKSAQLQLNA